MPVNRIEFDSNLNRIVDDLFATCEQRLLLAVTTFHGHVIRTLSGTRTGRIYKVPGTNRTYQASAEGEAPASRLGDLRTSYQFKVEGNGWNAVGYVGSPLAYAYFLEKGTKKMAKRPHLIKAYQENRQDIRRFFTGLI